VTGATDIAFVALAAACLTVAFARLVRMLGQAWGEDGSDGG